MGYGKREEMGRKESEREEGGGTWERGEGKMNERERARKEFEKARG